MSCFRVSVLAAQPAGARCAAPRERELTARTAGACLHISCRLRRRVQVMGKIRQPLRTRAGDRVASGADDISDSLESDKAPKSTASALPQPALSKFATVGRCEVVPLAPETDCTTTLTLQQPSQYYPCINASVETHEVCVVNDPASIKSQFGAIWEEFDPRALPLYVNDGAAVFKEHACAGRTLYHLPHAFVHDSAGVVFTESMYLRLGNGQ